MLLFLQPEWYFTQILGWIKDHQEFLSTRIQPLLEAAGPGYTDAVVGASREVAWMDECLGASREGSVVGGCRVGLRGFAK